MNAEFRKFFESYVESYDAFDVDGIMRFAHCPLVTVRDGEASVHATPGEVRKYFTELLEWFRGAKHGKGSVAGLAVTMLGPRGAFANVTWRSTHADGSQVTEWPTAYHLVKTADSWKILAIILRYEPVRVVKT